MNLLFDNYTCRARLWPPLLVTLPIGLIALAWFPDGIPGWRAIGGLVAWSGGTALLVQLGRDWGKRKEPKLFQLWGGKPTTRMLRHRDAPNRVTLARQRRKFEALTGTKMPTAEQEEANPRAADEVYESCAAWLREKTRDVRRFPLVFEENCNYGFRRNLWGMKPLAIMLATLGTVASIVLVTFDYFGNGLPLRPLPVVSALANMIILATWVFWFTPSWVRLAADAYAERLLAAWEEV